MEIKTIRSCFQSDHVLYSRHALFEMKGEEFGRIYDIEVEQAINNGEIIAEYPEDKPYPSVLIFGKTKINRPIHIVCAVNQNENMAIVVTVYHPDPTIWIDGRERRKQP
jgi:hypothetical protein